MAMHKPRRVARLEVLNGKKGKTSMTRIFLLVDNNPLGDLSFINKFFMGCTRSIVAREVVGQVAKEMVCGLGT